MKKIILCVVLCVSLVGCLSESGRRSSTSTDEIRVRCIRGVEYYIFNEWAGNVGFGYMSPKYNRDGRVSTCE